MRVLYLTNSPVPYRSYFFDSLGEFCDLTVVYERNLLSDRNESWQKSVTSLNYKTRYLTGIKVGNESSLCLSVIKALDTRQYDIFIIGGYSSPTSMLAIETLKRRKIPFFLNADGGIVNKDMPLKYLIKKHFIGSASEWLSSGAMTDRYLIHYGADPKHIHHYPFTSVKADYIEKQPTNENLKASLREHFNVKEEAVVMSVGQFIYRKGVDVLIKAAGSLVEKAGVYIIGGEPTEEYLTLQKQYAPDNVHFLKFMAHDELKKFYQMADLFVLPTRQDIWGLVINEAMANGLPVITTDNCVAGLELVEYNINGYIVPVEDIEGLSKKINVILEDDMLRRRMAIASLKKISEYSIENMAKAHIDIFEEFVSKKS